MKTVKPAFYDSFKCVADKCPDTCCKGWVIDVSPENMEYFRTFDGALGKKIREATKGYRTKYLIQKNGACPFLTECGLCEICIEKGTDALKDPCASYPRFSYDLGELSVKGMYLSCPVVAEHILENDGVLSFVEENSSSPICTYNDIDADLFFRLSKAYKELCDVAVSELSLEQKLYFILHTAKCIETGRETACMCLCKSIYSPKLKLALRPLEWLNTDLVKHWSENEQKATDTQLESLLLYFLHEHFMPVALDGRVFEAAAFIVGSIITILHLDIAPFSKAAQVYSKEIEHSPKNIKKLKKFWRRYYGRHIKM